MMLFLELYQGKGQVKHSLADVAKQVLGRVIDKSLQAQDWMAADLTPADIAYAMTDVRVTWECSHALHEQVHSTGLMEVYRLECALIPVVARMELNGLYVDQQVLQSAAEYYGCEKKEGVNFYMQLLDDELQAAGKEGLPRLRSGELNLNVKTSGSVRLSTKVLGIKPVNDAGKVSLDKKNLALFRTYPVVRAYKHFKKADKRSAMATKLQEHVAGDGRIHAQFMPPDDPTLCPFSK